MRTDDAPASSVGAEMTSNAYGKNSDVTATVNYWPTTEILAR